MYGCIPLGRSLLAQAIDNANHAGAKAVIIKFFLNQARSTEGDQRLASSMTTIPVPLDA